MLCRICNKEIILGKRPNKSGTCSRKCNAIYQNKIKAEKFVPRKCKNCGEEIEKRQSKRIFCSASCQKKWNRGKNHYRWTHGVSIHSEGYVLLRKPSHPFSDKKGWILQHRLILEEHLKDTDPESVFLENGYLRPNVVIHHKNGNKADNWINNLQLLQNQSEHMKIDNPKQVK